ncbi:S8 family peptidase [Pseudoalteromonas luteoviolacea]|uniref:Peptidase S8 n=1 Tax=Pseudoalteromonas luteoviolacea S4054 TaxID=1129367 RepID=A0A0F6A8S7_9GAMM|nr:S8 family peptidase [Pseudoalteromonas luteoviolacea]AOT07051.1 peptidase S8 [Pseudoalteromonas luteoviolacea]AOT11969.1 peptidase S8 [Pseudoalteromonas luteoviolacea]AOT16881.1 peptidase S8 [Pseudoalteromonas luteoviolacea]KKE82622.1 peptidase S8 [Pseudoalteromonas luteoviolacea S4054]KZN69944.1 peptidase S8 [Pseudoalteromonas luteoviolacea S4047-1]
MTTGNFKLAAISMAVTGLLSANAVMAMPQNVNVQTEAFAQAVPSQAQLAQKLESQSGFGTQFIIKYKNNNNDIMSLSSADMSATMMNTRARSFVKGFNSKRAAAKAQYVRPMALSNHHVMRADKKLSAAETQKFMQDMLASGNVAHIEVDQMLQPFATPNDPSYSSQWHYFEAAGGINAPAAWDKATGSGVVVAVLDTGYRPHADLNPNILQGYDMISNLSVANDGGGRDSDARDPGDAVTANECGYTHSARSSSWHGTHVAGTVAAVTNNGEGVAGVAYDSKVVPVRVLGKCGGLTSDIADGIIWASGGSVSGVPANANPADVINMSLGGSGACSSTTQNAINQARANGTVVVIAAGNDNDNANNYNPGNCSGVVNVASVGRNGGRAYYSNYGSSIDVAAPGGAQSFANDPEGILSTYNSGSNAPVSDSYSYSQGTSMAAPHVAGIAALIKQAKPTATPDEIETILKNTTRSFPATCTNCGTGIVDASAAVDLALGNDNTNPGDNVLVDGEAKTGLSGAKDAEAFFTFETPAGASKVTFTMSGGTGDADLYVRAGAKPTTSTYDCRPYEGGNNEVCTIDNASGTYHVMMRGYSAYNGVSLVANAERTGTQPGGITETNLSASTGNWSRHQVTVPAGMSSLTVKISGGSGDADLYVNPGSAPSTSTYQCRPYEGGNAETCTITNPAAGVWHIGLRAYRTFSGVTLDAQYK